MKIKCRYKCGEDAKYFIKSRFGRFYAICEDELIEVYEDEELITEAEYKLLLVIA